MAKKGDVVEVDHPIVQRKIDDSLNLSVKEGSLSSVSSGFGISYLSAFALAMNATASQMGILYAIVSLLPSIAQLKAAKLIEKFSRKKIVLSGVMGKILLWLPILVTGLLFYLGVPHMVWALIGFISIFYMFAAVAHPAWFSWMGSLVPEERRGTYFSRRNRAAGFFGIVTMVAGALLLDGSKKIGVYQNNLLGFTLLGFGLLFVLSAIFQIWSLVLLKRQYEPRLHVRKKDYFSFWQFLKRAPQTPFGRFVLFRGILGMAIGIAGPFWAVYMLRNLQFSYMWFMGITISGTVFQLMFLPLLGKASDRFGNIKILKICSALFFVVPILWYFSSMINGDLAVKLYLFFVPAIVSGFAWAGYNLAVNNYIYDSVKQEKRSFGVSYMNLVVGIGTFIGAGIGSLLALMNLSFMNIILFIFLVSAVARFVVAAVGMRFLKEVRHVKKFSSQYLLKEFVPMQGVVREIQNLEHMVKKVEHYI